MLRRSLRLPVAAAALLFVAGVFAACDDTFPNALSVYDGDAAVVDTGAPGEVDAGGDAGAADGGTLDASDAAPKADGGDAGHATDAGDAGEEQDGSTDAHFDAE